MGKTAFITGGTGFLGGHIIRLLKQANWNVVAMHRPGGNAAALEAMGATPVAASLHHTDEVAAAMPENVDAVFHIAGNTSMWKRNNAEQYRDNVEGTRAVAHAALTRGAHRLIQTSSISAYGFHDQPIDETTPSNAAEDWVCYNRTKYLAEVEVRMAMEKGLTAVIMNPCGIVGAGDTHNWSQMISLIQRGKLPGVPPGSGSFCHVVEVARAHIAAAERGTPGANYILAGVEASFMELVQTIGRLLNKPVPNRTVPLWVLHLGGHLYPLLSLFTGKEPDLTPEKVALVTNRVIARDDRAVNELGFNNRVPLETMLRECIDWMRREGML